jgi:glycosyltransferase involved in cell wall biosynthesis
MLGNFGDYCHQKEETPRLLSIVIPCFNAAATLGSTIKSALEQRGVMPELVVVDDGSTDNSIGIARTFEPRLRVLTGPNRGVSAARNRGIDETTGEWIVFPDAYDLLVFGTSRLRLEAAEPTGADVVCDWQEFPDRADGTADGAVTSVDFAALEADAEIGCATHFECRRQHSCIDAAFSRKLAGSARRAPKIGVRPSTTIRLTTLTQVIAKVSWIKIDNQGGNWGLIPCMEPGI